MKIKVLVWQEDDVWCASVPSLKGCHTWGESYEHLLEMVKEAIELYLDDSIIYDKANPSAIANG